MSITRKMLKGMGLTEDQQISTHAPARGATAILHKTGIGSGFKLQKTHIVFDPDFSNSCVNPQKAVQIIGIVCANLPQNSV